jgi:hypothetical protein
VRDETWPEAALVEVRKGRNVVAQLRRLFPGDLSKLHLPVELRPLEPVLRAVEAYEAAPPTTPDERVEGGALGALRDAILGLALGQGTRETHLVAAGHAGAALRVELRRLRHIEAAAQAVLQGLDPQKRGRKLSDLASALEGRAPVGPCLGRHRLGRPCELGAGHEGEHSMSIGGAVYTWAAEVS